MILNACVKNKTMIDENICKGCTDKNCSHSGEPTTKERLDMSIYGTPEEQIKTALLQLGVKGAAGISPAGHHRYQVEINGGYFGIFDIDRNTFVD